MRKILFVLIIGLSFITPNPQRPAVFSAEETPTVRKIGIVNLDQVFQEYERTKASDAKLEELSDSKQAERDKFVSEIKSMREELILLNQDARAERQKAIEEKLRELANFDQQVKENFRKQREETLKVILKDIEEIVTAYGKENGFDLVLNERAVLYQVEAIDITKEILTILNARYAKKPH